MFYPNSEPWICHDFILQIISYQIKDYMYDHGSIGLFLENSVFGGEFDSECFGLFPFLFFCLVRGREKSPMHKILVGSQRERTTSNRGFFSFFFACDNFVLFKYCLVRRPLCIFLLFSSDLWLRIFLFLLLSSDVWSGTLFFFCFLSIFWPRTFFFLFLSMFDRVSFLFCFLKHVGSLTMNESYFLGRSHCYFYRGQGWKFSSWVEVYGGLRFWLKRLCRKVGHDVCQGVGLAGGLGIKGMSHIISTTRMQQWRFRNFMQSWSCMHPCGHSSIKFCGHVTLGLMIHFSYLSQPSVCKTCSFINSCLYPSPFWVFGKIFTSFTL